MKDTISEEDIFIDNTKTDLENNLDATKRENTLLQERVNNMEIQMQKILEVTSRLNEKIN